MKHWISLFFSIQVLVLPASGQTASALLGNTAIKDALPTDLLRSRSIAIIDAPAATSISNAWQKTAEEAHGVLRGAGVDVVAYYNLQTLLSGPDATQAFLRDVQARDISNVLIFDQQADTKLTVAQLGNETFIDAAKGAWQTTAPSAKEASAALAKTAAQASLFHQNFLIGEVPEYFDKTSIGFKRKYFSYPLDLKFDKLAIPAYPFIAVNGADSLTAINSIMQATYPFEWGVTKIGTSENDLKLKQGYPFVLLYLRASPASIRNLLEYPPNEDSQPQLQYTGADQQLVYKFYIRQIGNNEVYMGTTWDAAPNWQQSLKNFMNELRKEQKR